MWLKCEVLKYFITVVFTSWHRGGGENNVKQQTAGILCLELEQNWGLNKMARFKVQKGFYNEKQRFACKVAPSPSPCRKMIH